jgi:hypothetical protein
MFRNLSEPWDFFFQTTHTGVIDVAPDHQTATARWEMREIARTPDGSQSYDNVAMYYDRLARTQDGSWRFAERRYYYIWLCSADLVGRSILAQMTRHNRTDPAEEQAAESARSRELFMPVSLLRGPGEANHRESVMTSHLPDGKPGSVATDIGSPDMTKRNRDLEHRGPAASLPGAARPPGRRPATPARTGTAAHRLVLAHLTCRARPPPGRLPPGGPAGRGRRQLHPHPLDRPVRRVLTQLIRNSPTPGTLPATLPALPPQQAAPQDTSMQVTRDAADDRTPAANGELAAAAFAARRREP